MSRAGHLHDQLVGDSMVGCTIGHFCLCLVAYVLGRHTSEHLHPGAG
jgi:hypothetical protein